MWTCVTLAEVYYAVVLLQRTASRFHLKLGWRTKFNSLSSYYTVICAFKGDFQCWHILVKQAFSFQQIFTKTAKSQPMPAPATPTPWVSDHSYSKQSLSNGTNMSSVQSSTCLEFAFSPCPSEVMWHRASFFFCSQKMTFIF